LEKPLETIDPIFEALKLRNWYAGAALILALVIQLIRKNPNWPVLAKLKALWNKTPDGYRFLWPTTIGAVTAFVAAFEAGVPLTGALLAALGGALGIGIPSMGVAAVLKESPIPWDGGKGGAAPSPRRSGTGKGERISLRPPPPSALAIVGLILCALPLFTGCASVKDVVWPTVAKCAPAPKQIVSDVIDVLRKDPGGSLTERGMNLLEELARKHGESVIACTIADVADRMSGSDDPDELRMRGKAKDFFETTQVVTE
jgi:hypothetical protein